VIGMRLRELAGSLCICPVGQLEQLYSARAAAEYDEWDSLISSGYRVVGARLI
jgi:hypothetical protein